MKHRILSIIAAILVACGYAAAEEAIERYEIKVGNFNELSLVDGINVVYHCSEDSAGLAVFDASKNVADKLIFDTSKEGRLVIEKQFHEEQELVRDLPTVHVYSKFLTLVKNSGDSTLIVASVAPTQQFKAVIIGNGRIVVRDVHCNKFDGAIKTGNGQIVVSGKCDNASLSNTGVGNIQADALEAKEASCRFFGTGSTGVWATGTLIIKGMFPGNLYYKGTPKKIKNYSMGVKIHKLDE